MTNAPETSSDRPNRYQRAVAQTYADGMFLHLLEQGHWRSEVPNCGDTLFAFLMIELSCREDCTDLETALSRTARAAEDLQMAYESLRQL